MGYNFRVEYKKGKENTVADALSRIKYALSTLIWSAAILAWITEVVKSYKEDPKCSELTAQLAIAPTGHSPYTLTSGVLRYKGKNPCWHSHWPQEISPHFFPCFWTGRALRRKSYLSQAQNFIHLARNETRCEIFCSAMPCLPTQQSSSQSIPRVATTFASARFCLDTYQHGFCGRAPSFSPQKPHPCSGGQVYQICPFHSYETPHLCPDSSSNFHWSCFQVAWPANCYCDGQRQHFH